jgi:error-prone DNA polymerase
VYTELQVTSNFSFLDGASHPDDLAQQAAALGYTAIGITDTNTLAGIVRAHTAAKKAGIRIIVGCRLDLVDGTSLLCYPTNKQAYARLTNLLSIGNARTEKGQCHLYKQDVYKYANEMKFIIVPPTTLNEGFQFDIAFENDVNEYATTFRNNVYIAASRRYNGDDHKQLYRIAELSQRYDVPVVATNDVHYHIAERRELQDVMTCIREKKTIYNAGFLLHPNAERYLKPPAEMIRLFRNYPGAIANTKAIEAACTFSLAELKYEYPEEITTEGRTPQQEITHLAWKGAAEIFGESLPEKVVAAIKHELFFIEQMNYASYFLTVYDIVRFARAKIFFAREVVPRLIQQYVFVWASHQSILKNLTCYLNVLFLLQEMNLRILM